MVRSSPDSKQSSHSPQKRAHKKHSSSGNSSKSPQRQRSAQNRHSKPKKRQGQSRHEKRSRSRQKSHKNHNCRRDRHEDKQDNQSGRILGRQAQNHSDLHLYEHLCFLQDQNSKVSVQVAIWNIVVAQGLRPKKILIICENQKKINRQIKSSNINRKVLVISHDSKQDIRLLSKSYDIIFMTQEKSSITLGLDEGDIQFFDVVVNYGKSYSIEYYELLPQFLGEHGIIFTVFEERKQLQRHQRKLKIRIKESTGEMSSTDVQKQIFNQIQFSKQFSMSESMEDLTLLKTLPYSLQQTAVRLLSLLKQAYQPIKSLYGKRQGHVTFCLKTETEFNSIKYIWNFIREQLSPSAVKNIKDMKKFQNQRGAVFNVPLSDLNKWQSLQSKILRNDKKYKGYQLSQLLNEQLPKLQDTQSQEYKMLQQKKQQALRSRNQLELFMAGIPYDVNQVDIRKFFGEKRVNLFLIRILRDSSGFSKGIAFGLAENQQHFDKAIRLNGEKFGDRQLRIKLADQRDQRDK